jgi:phage gp16-like protein
MSQPKTYSNIKHEQRRNSALGKIHIAKKQLSMDEETYRAMLLTFGGVKSSMDLTPEGLDKVIRHLEKSGAVFTKAKKQTGKLPNNLGSESDRAAKLSKIEALLAEASRPWAYAASMAERMYKKEAIEFCSHAELTGIIAGLTRNAEREGRRAR